MRLKPIAFGAFLIFSAMPFVGAKSTKPTVLNFPTKETITSTDALKAALIEAKAEHKNVLIDFGASWCPWCVRLNQLINDKSFSPKFIASYVILEITIEEVPAKKNLTNPGWKELMAKYRPTKDGDIPYLVVLDRNGKKLGDSYEPTHPIPSNAGFPQTPGEIQAYLTLLKHTAKGFNDADLANLKTYFENVRSQIKSSN